MHAQRRAPRDKVAAIIGAEVGFGIGLLALGGITLAPLGLGVAGAAIGFGAVRVRHLMVRRWLRAQLRGSA